MNPDRIVALAISNQRETFVPLDRDGNCLRPAIVWLDERCKDEVESFAKKIGKNKIHRITGKPADYAPVVYRLAWMKKNEPRVYKKIGLVCDVHTYLVWKLTDTFKTSWASADPLGIFDVEKKMWSQPILRALDVTERQLPQAYRPGCILGRLTAGASKSTGLRAGVMIIAGGGDGQAAGLGSNVLAADSAYLNLGTAVVAGVYGHQYVTSKSFRTMCSCTESGYYYECSLRAGTFAIDWFIKNILMIDPVPPRQFIKNWSRKRERVPAGSNGLFHLPYICGVMNPFWNIHAQGCIRRALFLPHSRIYVPIHSGRHCF